MTLSKDIYIVLTGTGTAFSGFIRWFTKADLNHASIAFDSELREVYSFGRKKMYNPVCRRTRAREFCRPFLQQSGLRHLSIKGIS
jgi:hypothetical protein